MCQSIHSDTDSLDDIGETAVTTPFEFFELFSMQLGLKVARKTFQRLPNKVAENKSDKFRRRIDSILYF